VAITISIAHTKAAFVKNRQAVRSVAALFSGSMVSSVLGVAGGLFVARILGPEEVGHFQSYAIPLRVLTFLHLGTYDGLWRQIPFYIGKQRPEKVEALAASAGAWNMLVSVVVSAGFFLCALYSLWHRDLYGCAGWCTQALCCWGIFYSGYLVATYRTINQFVTLARIQFVQAIVNFGMIAVVPSLQFFGLCMRSIAPSAAGVLLYHHNRPLKVAYRFRWKALGEVVRIGFPFSIWGSLYSSVWIAAESGLMLTFGGVEALGIFSVALVLREGINVLPLAVNQVMMPRVVERFARSDSVRSANAGTVWLTAGLVGFMIVVVVAVSLLLDIVVPAAIPKYAGGISLMKLCLWFAVIETASLPLNTLFATGRSWLMGRSVIVGYIVFPLTAYALTPVLGGVYAVAAGSLAGRAARTIAAYLEIAVLMRREDQKSLSMEFYSP
jgi:O-antigen/teichoic acid export membrane protein